MTESTIMELLHRRDPEALSALQREYHRYCTAIAGGILADRADVEEVVADVWMQVWNSIPPNRPERLGAFLGKITRNLALDRLRMEKRRCPIREELAECLTAGDPTGAMTDRVVLTAALDRFLAGLPPKKRKLFLRRYWYFATVEELTRDFGMSESSVKMTLLRLRRELKEQLKQEGIEP